MNENSTKKPPRNFHCSNFLNYFVTLMIFQMQQKKAKAYSVRKTNRQKKWTTIDSVESRSMNEKEEKKYLYLLKFCSEISIFRLCHWFQIANLSLSSPIRLSLFSSYLLQIVFYSNDKRKMKRKKRIKNTDRFQVNWTATDQINVQIYSRK